MIHSIPGFPHYKYDDEAGIVFTYHSVKRNEVIITQLKWLPFAKGRRVTLFEGGLPKYLTERQIIRRISSIEVVEVSKDLLDEKQEEIRTFFESRENKSIRKDTFVKKFGEEVTCASYLQKTKEGGHAYFSYLSTHADN